MKNTIFLLLIALLSINTFAQTLKAVTIIKQRDYYLNGGARATLAGGKSRETIKVDLPENTKCWYYSFTTSPGTDVSGYLNLGMQLTAVMYGGIAGAKLASKIKVPKGSGAADVYVLQPHSRDNFLNKEEEDWEFYKDISLQNTTQAVQYVDNVYGGSVYLGLRNPSALTGLGISIEVVAIVEEQIKVEVSEKGILYENLGRKSYENGDFKKSVELSEKALTFNPKLTSAKFNIAIARLAQKKNDCLDYYVDAIASCKNENEPKTFLNRALQDVRNLKMKKSNLKNIDEIENLINNELIKHQH